MILEPVESDNCSDYLIRAEVIKKSYLKDLKPNEIFIDPDFPPIIDSIGEPDNLPNFPIKWCRMTHILGDEFSSDSVDWAVTRNPSCEDIVQGRLGNCWFMTGLTLIANRDDLINRVLITKEIDPNGIYQVMLCKDGIWEIVTVDDHFPTYDNHQMIYSRANRKQLWVSIVEKALAKLHGSYEALSCGCVAVGLSILTGCSSESFIMGDYEGFGMNPKIKNKNELIDTLWAKVLSALEAKLLIATVCGNYEVKSDSLLRDYGLCNVHSYAVLDAVNVPELNERLIRLKNPWSRVCWKGKWSNGDVNWSLIPNHYQAEFNMHYIDDFETFGIFWMSWDDFMKHFTSVDICNIDDIETYDVRMKTHLPWPVWVKFSDFTNGEVDTNATGKISIPDSVCRSTANRDFENYENTCAIITIMEPTVIRFVLWQCLDRQSKNTSIPRDLLIVVLRGYNSGKGDMPYMKYVASSKRQLSNFVVCETLLKPGLYTVFYFSFMHWCENRLPSPVGHEMFPPYASPDAREFKCVLSVHSKQPFVLQKSLLSAAMIPYVMVQFVVNKGQVLDMGYFKIYSVCNNHAGLIECAVNKQRKEKRLITDSDESVNVINSRGHPYNCKITEDIVYPNFAQITTLLTQESHRSRYHIKVKHSIIEVSNFSHRTQNHPYTYPQFEELGNKRHTPDVKLVVHAPVRF